MIELLPLLIVVGIVIGLWLLTMGTNRRSERFVAQIARSVGSATSGSAVIGNRRVELSYSLRPKGRGMPSAAFYLETAAALGVDFEVRRRPPGILSMEILPARSSTVACETGDRSFDRAFTVRASREHAATVSKAFATPEVRECLWTLGSVGLEITGEDSSLRAGAHPYSPPSSATEAHAAKVVPAFVRLADLLESHRA